MMPLTGLRVLIIEDESLVAMLVEDTLREAGCEVMGPAGSVEDALRLIRLQRPDAAVLDLNLGGESSLPVADRLAQAGVPFVVTTGYGAAGLPATHSGAPVLAKPYDPADLRAALRRVSRQQPG